MRRRITSGSNRLRAAGPGFAALRWRPLFRRNLRRCPPALLLPGGPPAVLAAHPRVIRTGWLRNFQDLISMLPFQKVCATFQVHRLRKKPRPELPRSLEPNKRCILEAVPELQPVAASARKSCRFTRHFCTYRRRIEPGLQPRLLRNLSGAGNALIVPAALPTFTGALSCFARSSTSRHFGPRHRIAPVPMRDALAISLRTSAGDRGSA